MADEHQARPTTPAGVLLTVPGPRPARVAAQAVAVAAVLSVPAAVAVDPVAAAVALLVLGGVTLARVLVLPATLQALLGAALIAAGWASAVGLYETVPWVDVPAHLLVNGLIAAALGIVLLRGGLLADPATRAGRAGIALTTASVGVALGVLWEIAEWAGYTFVDESVYVSYGDTIGDLIAGGLGCAGAGLLVARWTR
ncbi:hypothetical protein M3148_14830 [Georgenia satyanarayanai]|uniref:hypothetical protein n=1 Tax=Georgenia satyanarayanai TaxID=860221 RepID=UPI00203A485D|nr:hypothetical protein [Georgenia satyanarayanai]MCM3662256.1 hypothetical protein [Georgenia satyanarayanai]